MLCKNTSYFANVHEECQFMKLKVKQPDQQAALH